MSTVTAAEQAKYEKIWAVPEYSDHSPGERMADLFAEVSGAPEGSVVFDFGTGSGKGAVALAERGYRPILLDLTPGGLVEGARAFPFIQASLWGDWDDEALERADSLCPDIENPVYGYCCDVMEHIPPEYTMLVVDRMLHVCDGGLFLNISFLEDNFGKVIGQSLHLTVRPFSWWRDRLRELGEVTDARDMLGQGTFFVRRK